MNGSVYPNFEVVKTAHLSGQQNHIGHNTHQHQTGTIHTGTGNVVLYIN